jgi:hypothetical protein
MFPISNINVKSPCATLPVILRNSKTTRGLVNLSTLQKLRLIIMNAGFANQKCQRGTATMPANRRYSLAKLMRNN